MPTVLRRAILPISLLAFAVVAAPLLLTSPGLAQTETHLTWAYRLARIGLPFGLAALAAAMWVAIASWRTHSGLAGRTARVLAVVTAGAAVWLSTVNVTEWMFNPLAASHYVRLAEANHLDGNDLILGIHRNGQALIYPVDIVGYHHILNERLQGEPFVVTY